MNAVFDTSQKDLRTKNRKRLVVFAASMQRADAVKVASRGPPRSRTSVTWGIRWSVSAVEKDGESGGRFPTVRHAHLLGLIGRSHFPAKAQAEEMGIEGDLIEIVGTPFSRHLQKGKENHRERWGDYLYITEKVMGQRLNLGERHYDREPPQKRTPSIWTWYD